MILYNMRYRGPYEYDKFVLNVFQIHNEIENLRTNYLDNNLKPYLKDYDKLLKYEKEIRKKDSSLEKLIEIELTLD